MAVPLIAWSLRQWDFDPSYIKAGLSSLRAPWGWVGYPLVPSEFCGVKQLQSIW